MELVTENSFSWNKEGTDRVAAKVVEKLGPVLPIHRVVEQEKVGDLRLLSNVSFGEKSIYVLAHMDTVFPPDHPFQECWIEGNRLRGPGAGDMKAGVVTVIYAALALAEAGVLDRVPLTLVFAGDEEVGAVASRATYGEEIRHALACLVVEGAGKEGEIVLSRFGKIGGRLECRGRDQHVGAKELQKASAILEMAHKTIGIEELNGSFPDTRLNVGKVEGGLGPATIPASATALLDVRWKDQSHRDRIVDAIREVVSRKELPGCASELVILNERPAWPATPGTERLAALVQEAGAEVGQTIGFEHRMGSSDSNFFGAAGVPTVDGIGPICEGYHTAEEFVYISSISQRTILLANSLVKVAAALSEPGPELGGP
jgi:glutamate carboxypeptidase